eukprot:606266_1
MHIVDNALKSGMWHIGVASGMFDLRCWDESIPHPFTIHLASKNRMKQVAASISYHPNLYLLKKLLPNNRMYGTDWRHYKVWGYFSLLNEVTRRDIYPFECIKYLVDVLQFDVHSRMHFALQNAAMRHDIDLLNLLFSYGIDPSQKSDDKYKETALQKCQWSYNEHVRKYKKYDIANDDIIQLQTVHEAEGHNEVDDLKYECVYIKSIFWVQMIFYLIKLKKGSPSYKRICLSKGWMNINQDIVLTANIADKSISFQIYETLPEQHWFIEDVYNHSNWYTFGVFVKDKEYELVATKRNQLALREIGTEDKAHLNHINEIEQKEPIRSHTTIQNIYSLL